MSLSGGYDRSACQIDGAIGRAYPAVHQGSLGDFKMNWRFRSAGYVIVFVAGVSVGMVLANRLAGEQYALRGVEARSSENAAKRAAAAGPQTRLEFSGNGPAASDEFDLGEGPARISVEYDGHNWLWVELAEVGRSGEPIIGGLAFAGSNVGPWKTRAMARVSRAGRYRIDVKTEGNWKVSVAQ